MAVTIANYSYRQKITGDAPASSLSGFTVLITEANVDSTFWDNVDNGGGDVRVAIEEDGTSQLPLEIVLCDTSTDELIAWVRFPTYSTSARELYVFSGNTGESKLGDGTTYGRDNVWQDFHFASHDGVINSTGSGATQTETGTPVFDSDGVDLPNATVVYDVASLEDVEVVSLSINVTPNSSSSDDYFSVVGENAINGGGLALGISSNTDKSILVRKDNSGGDTRIDSGNNEFTVGTKLSLYCTYSQVDGVVIYKNGSSIASGATNGSYKSINPKLKIGDPDLDMVIHSIYVPVGVVSADKVTLEFSNQDDPTNFWAQSTPDDPSGGTNIDVDVTGVEATTAVGTVTVTTGSVVALTGVEATGAVGTVTVTATTDVDVDVTGVEATGAVGTTTVTTGSVVALTGVEATGAVGTATVTTGSVVALTGVEATGAVGTATADTSSNIDVDVTGVEATGTVGTATVTTGSVVALTGVEATGAVGTATVNTSSDVDIDVTGVEATGAVGTATVTTGSVVALTGVEATSAVGTVTVTATTDVDVDVTGIEATGAVGTVTITENTGVDVTGVQTTTALGNLSTVTGAVVALTGVEATGAVGTATVNLNSGVSVTGVQATTALGSVTALSTVIVPITGLVAYARTSTANVWGLIDSSQTPSWDTIANPQVPDWNDIPT